MGVKRRSKRKGGEGGRKGERSERGAKEERKRKGGKEGKRGKEGIKFPTLQTSSYSELLWLMELDSCFLFAPESCQLFWLNSSTPIQGLSPMVHIATDIHVPTKHNMAVFHQMI